MELVEGRKKYDKGKNFKILTTLDFYGERSEAGHSIAIQPTFICFNYSPITESYSLCDY